MLARSSAPARELRADHEDELLAHLALVAIVLLVNAVELQKFVIVLRKGIEVRILQRLLNRARKPGAGLFKTLVASEFSCRSLLIISDTPMLVNYLRDLLGIVKRFSLAAGFWRYSFPHFLLSRCSPKVDFRAKVRLAH